MCVFSLGGPEQLYQVVFGASVEALSARRSGQLEHLVLTLQLRSYLYGRL